MQKKEVVLAITLVLVTLVFFSNSTSSVSSGTSININLNICQNSSANNCTAPTNLTCAQAEDLGLIKSSITGGNATVTNLANSSYKIGLAVYKIFDSNNGIKILSAVDLEDIGYNQTSKLVVPLPTCKYQVNLFCGDPISNFTTNSVYGDRLIKFQGSTLPFCTTPPPAAVCGNGIKEGTEQCDDGNQINTDSCSNSCQSQTITCKTDPDCDDNNTLTFDQCINANTSLSFCRNTPINCATDLDCGTSGFTGIEFCTANNITKNFQDFECVNPATTNSFCVSTVDQIPIQQCPYACSNAACIRCDEDLDCNDNQNNTIDVCKNPGTVQSFCENIVPPTPVIICNNNLDCGVSGPVGNEFCSLNNLTQNFINFTCTNPGTSNSFCSNSTSSTVNQCQDYCSDGQCNFFVCKENSTCGLVTESPSFCENKTIVKNITSPICLNPSTSNSQCSSTITKQIIETCDYQCSNGACVSAPVQNFTCEEAIDQGILSGILQGTKATITNNASHSFPIGLAIYKVFPGDITNQTLFESNSTIISNFSTIDLTGNAPDCAYQVNLFCGAPILNFSNTEEYGNRSLAGISNNSLPLCENPIIEVCGNNIVEGTEQCDDGNTVDNDTCSNSCQSQTITCKTNLECGSSTNSSLFCVSNSTALNSTNFVCNNANTSLSFCSSTTTTTTIEQCSLSCNNGACTLPPAAVCGNGIKEGTEQCDDGNQINTDSCSNLCIAQNITCTTDSQCTDNNTLTFDQCINANTSLSFCRNTPINCATDLDCGTSGFIGIEFCTANNITKNFQDFECVNPATTNSFCVSAVEARPVQQCTYACSSASCVRCDENIDCNDNNNITTDICVSPGTSQSFCENIAPPIACSQNSDCGLPTSSELFCVAKNVSQTVTDYTCLNPGTPQSQCTSLTQVNDLLSCQFMCANGACSQNQTNATGDAIFIRIDSPMNVTYTTTEVSVIITSNGTNIWFNIDNGPNQTYTSPVNINISQGSHQLNAFANTTLGNQTSAFVNFVVNASTSSGGGGGSGSGGSLYYPSIRKDYSEPALGPLYTPFPTNTIIDNGFTTLNPIQEKAKQNTSLSLAMVIIVSTLALLIIVISLAIYFISGRDADLD